MEPGPEVKIFEMKHPDHGSLIKYQIDQEKLNVMISDGVTASQQMSTDKIFDQVERIYNSVNFVSKNVELIEKYPMSFN